MSFPTVSWNQMDQTERRRFLDMSEEDLVTRWDSPEGEEIKARIIAINLEHGSSERYKEFVGTIRRWLEE